MVKGREALHEGCQDPKRVSKEVGQEETAVYLSTKAAQLPMKNVINMRKQIGNYLK